MSRWTHASCLACYHVKYPGKWPPRAKAEVRETETCCYCGTQTVSGIYVRDDPNTLKCGGKHNDA